ncbi:MAG: hypothetical protein ACI9WU_002028 [Myxococcota bacterium]|jgi:hypothetical protein
MSGQAQTELPSCGLYRTGRSLAGHEEAVPAGALIYFHNHSDQGPPLVLAATTNTNNKWTFSDRGWLAEDAGFVRELIPLKREGLYVVSGRHLHLNREQILPEKSLVQVGYNRRGDTILFPAKFEANGIQFPERGFRFESPDVLQQLVGVNFVVPKAKAERVLH